METKILETDPEMKKKLEKNYFRKFLVYWLGQIVSLIGSSIVMFVLIWELTEIAGNNNTILSIAFFLGFLPSVIFMPIAGVISDKFDKRKVIILSDSLQALFTFLLIPILWFTSLQVWHILVVNFLRGTCQAFHSPTSFSLTTLLVPKKKLSRMNGMNYLASGLVNSIGPVIGAFLMIYFATSTILWLDGLTFLIALVGVLQLRMPPKPAIDEEDNPKIKEKPERQSFGASFKEGIHTIRAIPGLIGIMIMATFTNFLFQPIDTLLPNFIKYVHSGSKEDLAFFIALFQAGILIGAVIATAVKNWKRPLLWISIGMYVSSIGFILLGVVPTGKLDWLNVIPLPMMLLNPVVNAIFLTLVQLIIPQEKMGRVIAVLMLMSSVASPIGMLIAGPLADLLGSIQLLYIICGILSILIISVTLYRKPSMELMKTAKIELNK
jgi:DHA3 family macrolide efflux protein-like MFS transporter